MFKYDRNFFQVGMYRTLVETCSKVDTIQSNAKGVLWRNQLKADLHKVRFGPPMQYGSLDLVTAGKYMSS